MGRIKIYIAGCLLMWTCVVGAEREPPFFLSTKMHSALRELKGPARTVLEARQLGEVLYFSEAREAIERGIESGSDGVLSFRRVRFLEFGPKKVYQNGVLISRRQESSRDDLEKAAVMYKEALSELTKSREEGKTVKVPFAFVGAEVWPISAPGYDLRKFDLEKVWRGYEARPSDLAALVYLELALTEKKLGRTEEYSKLLKEAVAELKLLEIHYCPDTIFREHLHGSLNFARPETCLLFLAGEDARLDARSEEAQKYYAALIERAPGSPFAWEALAKMVSMPDTDAEQVEWLKSILLHTYPLVWGCPRAEVKLEREEFAKQLSALLETAGKEKSGKKGQASDKPRQKERLGRCR